MKKGLLQSWVWISLPMLTMIAIWRPLLLPVVVTGGGIPVTTDYILSEAITLLRSRRALRLRVFSSMPCLKGFKKDESWNRLTPGGSALAAGFVRRLVPDSVRVMTQTYSAGGWKGTGSETRPRTAVGVSGGPSPVNDAGPGGALVVARRSPRWRLQLSGKRVDEFDELVDVRPKKRRPCVSSLPVRTMPGCWLIHSPRVPT